MNSNPKIAILLATYNGARFLQEQLNSIATQSYQHFVIVVRDDVSSDETSTIVAEFQKTNPDRVHVVPNGGENLGPSGSFSYLIEYTLANKETLGLESAYMMFCDQDDVWFEEKLEKQVDAILIAENIGSNQSLPVLVHSDLQVVSQEKEPLAESFVRYQGLEIERNRFPNIVISNLVTGCTALINETLASKAVPVSRQAIMHDWWLALVASAFGKVVFLDTPLVHYRQHDSNTIGAKEFVKPTTASGSFWKKVFGRKPNKHLLEVAIQATAFRECYGAELNRKQRLGLLVASSMSIQTGFMQRIFYRIARRF